VDTAEYFFASQEQLGAMSSGRCVLALSKDLHAPHLLAVDEVEVVRVFQEVGTAGE
jgi:hypothetical protein